MPISVTVTTNFPEVGARFERAAAAAPGFVHGAIGRIVEPAKTMAEETIRSFTPHLTGALADSTVSEVEMLGDGAKIDISQPLEVSSSRNTWVLSALIIGGEAGGTVIVPLNADGYLFWEGAAHPVKSVTMTARTPNDYPEKAAPEISSSAGILLGREGLEVLTHIVEVLH